MEDAEKNKTKAKKATDYKELYEKMQKKWAAQEALITALKKEIQKLKG
jgi:hypothetical protein